MSRQQKKVRWDVSGFGKRGIFLARHIAGAVSQFKKAFNLPVKSHRIEGNWPGIHVDLAK